MGGVQCDRIAYSCLCFFVVVHKFIVLAHKDFGYMVWVAPFLFRFLVALNVGIFGRGLGFGVRPQIQTPHFVSKQSGSFLRPGSGILVLGSSEVGVVS